MSRAGRAALFAAALWASMAPVSGLSQTAPTEIAVTARPIEAFRIGGDETRFGPLEFVGGLELVSRSRHFGAVSSFRFLQPGTGFLAVADTGFWLSGRILRDDAGRPTGYADVAIEEMTGPSGEFTREKWLTDAESLAMRDGEAIVGFEREHRISVHALDGNRPGRRLRDIPFLVPVSELRRNRGFETLAFAPPGSPLDGALVAVTEKSLDKNGDIFAAVLDGPKKGIFTVARFGEFDVTDGAFLPGGDLILLERRFSIATGVGMQLRRIPQDEIAPGRRAVGNVLFEAGMSYQIDNMEALDVWQRDDGAVMLSLMSDDNHSILQRNLYLEFRLIGE